VKSILKAKCSCSVHIHSYSLLIEDFNFNFSVTHIFTSFLKYCCIDQVQGEMGNSASGMYLPLDLSFILPSPHIILEAKVKKMFKNCITGISKFIQSALRNGMQRSRVAKQ
jgi:hypothetical protein